MSLQAELPHAVREGKLLHAETSIAELTREANILHPVVASHEIRCAQGNRSAYRREALETTLDLKLERRGRVVGKRP